MIIYGAGMAGLLAGNMLRRHSPIIREAQPSLPDNHGALLRFRSDAVASATGQSFTRVRVQKAIESGGGLRTWATLRDNNLYSHKVTGKVMDRSLLNLEPAERFVAPDDFLEEMARGLDVQFEAPLGQGDVQAWDQSLGRGEPLGPGITTIPMPVMMDLVGWEEKPDFNFQEIWSVRADISSPEARVYQTIYYPQTWPLYYRASITGNHLIIEYRHQPDTLGRDIREVLLDFGIPEPYDLHNITKKHQKYGKLVPIDERIRKRFIMYLTDRYNLYSVGRFATWRQILMDDVVNDINLVAGWITSRDGYDRAMHWRNGQ
jgi:hypothetical protein